MKDERSSVEIRQELEDAKARLESLTKERKQIEDRLAEVKLETSNLDGGPWSRGYGSIQRLECELASTLLREQDAEKPRVVFKKSPWNEDYIVSRVTPKRIYLRVPGHKYESQYYKDGTAVSGSGVIDIEATFPEGLK